jgi:hypothetical protein
MRGYRMPEYSSDFLRQSKVNIPKTNLHASSRVLGTDYFGSFSVGQVVLGYLTGQPFPVFPLVGPKILADLQDNLRSVETRLSTADINGRAIAAPRIGPVYRTNVAFDGA